MTNVIKKTIVDIKDSVSDTLFIPLYMRAKLTKMNSPIIVDTSAVELCERLDYDFSKYDKVDLSLTGCGVRADFFDRLCVQEIQKSNDNNKKLIIVCVGCGLDNRLARVQNHLQNLENLPESKKIQNLDIDWYEMDLPEVIELRKELLPMDDTILNSSLDNTFDTINHQYIDDSLLENAWLDKILQNRVVNKDQDTAKDVDFLFITEGVLMYFPESQVKSFFIRVADEIKKNFDTQGLITSQKPEHTPKITLGFDTVGSFGVKTSKKHDAIKNTDSDVTFKWAVDDVNILHTWHGGYHLRSSYKTMQLHKNEWSFVAKMIRLVPTFNNSSQILVYDLHL